LNIQEAYDRFLQHYEECCKRYVSLWTPRDKKDPLWLRADLKRLIRTKRNSWLRYKALNSSAKEAIEGRELLDEYRKTCKEVRRREKEAIINFETELLVRSKKNQKLVYAYIKNRQEVQHKINSLVGASGLAVEESMEIANILNTHFSSVNKECRQQTMVFQNRSAECCDNLAVIINETAVLN
jgi:hypothetical protein